LKLPDMFSAFFAGILGLPFDAHRLGLMQTSAETPGPTTMAFHGPELDLLQVKSDHSAGCRAYQRASAPPTCSRRRTESAIPSALRTTFGSGSTTVLTRCRCASLHRHPPSEHPTFGRSGKQLRGVRAAYGFICGDDQGSPALAWLRRSTATRVKRSCQPGSSSAGMGSFAPANAPFEAGFA
jgi:hypothetical protein